MNDFKQFYKENEKEDILGGLDAVVQQRNVKRQEAKIIIENANDAMCKLGGLMSELEDAAQRDKNWSEAKDILGYDGAYAEDLLHVAHYIKSVEDHIYHDEDED